MTDSADDTSVVGDWVSIVRAVDVIQGAFAVELDRLAISPPYFSVLTLLFESEHERLPMSRIARDLAMSSGGFTKLADRMARDGLIDRRGSSGDRRVVFAALTDSGRDQARRASEAYQEFLRDQVLRWVSRSDLRATAEIASRLIGARDQADDLEDSFELTRRGDAEPERREH